MDRTAQLPETEYLAQRIELLIPGGTTRGIIGKRVRLDAELIPDEPERSIRDEFAGFQQSARISQGAELQRKTEAVVGTPPAREDAQICGTERPVSHQIWLALRQGEQLGVLRLGQNRAAGYRVRP
ncbi:hypothetical protein NX02_02360 [Sphingomonas sanxanigenens DSM 19645 = NX02]|uniref:Uncharacterized protein n=1 Tax=Sphingomonas sanxanigenens DSM 19645 = NX02 TaxID=1123269 RepID=W0A6Y3_9SPHN|nr:hypothetical protein NX02_02360 [Sphingomonas sanxanigenens DSM 19645 = NX02]